MRPMQGSGPDLDPDQMIGVWPLTSGMTSGLRHSLPQISRAYPERNGDARGRLPKRTIVPLADVASEVAPGGVAARSEAARTETRRRSARIRRARRNTGQDTAGILVKAVHLEVRDNRMGAWEEHPPSVKNPVSALGESKARRDAEFTEYVTGRMAAWRRVGYLLCQDWYCADDLVQGAITKLSPGGTGCGPADHIYSCYGHVVLVREVREASGARAGRGGSRWTGRCPICPGGARIMTPRWTSAQRWPPCRVASGRPWCCDFTAT